MPSIIDALVITLGFDTKGLKKGEAEAKAAQANLRGEAERTRKAFEESNRRVAQSITSARNAAVGLFGVMAAGRGINSLVNETTQASAALGRMARNLNVSTEALSAYEGVSRQVGNSAGQVTSALEATQNQIQQFRLLGASMPSMPVFRSLGIALADSRGNARETTAIYNDVLDALHRRPAQERATLAAGLGYGQETVNLAAVPAAQRQQMLAQARADSPTAQSTAAAARREAAWVRLDRAVMRVTDQILLAMTPTIEFVVEQLSRLASFLGEHALTAFTSIEAHIRRFAGYIGSQDFQDDMAAFVRAIRDTANALLEWLRWLGVLPGDSNRARVEGPDGTTDWTRGPNGELVPTPLTPASQAAGGRLMTQHDGRQFRVADVQTPDSFMAALEAAEGGAAGDAAANPLSSARGAHQFTDGTFLNVARRFGGARIRGLSDQQILALRGDREFSRAMARAHIENDIVPAMTRANLADTGLSRYAGWHFGTAGGAAVMNADPGRAMSEILTPGAIAANPYLARMTAGQWRERFARRFSPIPFGSAPAPAAPAAVGRTMTPAEAAAAAQGVRIGPDPGLIPGAGGAALRDNVRPNQTSSNETSIGAVSIVTQATDAGGIARDFASAVRRMTFVDQATEGLA